MRRSLLISLSIVVASLCAIVATPRDVNAAGLKAEAWLTQYKTSSQKTEASLISFVKKNQATKLQETTEPNIDDRKWLAELVVKFNAPLRDFEFHALVYDVEEGKRLVADISMYLEKSDQKVYVQKLKLERKSGFKPNRHMEMVLTVKHQEVKTIKFQTQGEQKRNSGVVNFE